MADEIDIKLRTFVSDSIDSVATLELILILRKEPHTDWTAQEVSRALGLSLPMAVRLLARLYEQGLASMTDESKLRYHYRAKSEEIDQLLGDLEKVYAERPVSVIQLIYGERSLPGNTDVM